MPAEDRFVSRLRHGNEGGGRTWEMGKIVSCCVARRDVYQNVMKYAVNMRSFYHTAKKTVSYWLLECYCAWALN